MANKIKLNDINDSIAVQELDKAIQDKFLVTKLKKQGLQVNLQELYKPLLESQNKLLESHSKVLTSQETNKDAIIEKLNRMSNIDNSRFLDLKRT